MAGEAPTALVTGGSGFVGSHAVDALLEAGYRCRCLVRPTSRLRWLEDKPVELTEADLRSADLQAAVRDVDVVVHCAGLTRGSSAELEAANALGTRTLLDACLAEARRRPERLRFVFCSSQAAAGPSAPDRPRALEDPPEPRSDYGRSKLAAEREVLKEADRLQVTVLRPVAVYGPRDEDTLPVFRMAARGLIVVPGWRRRQVQLVHVRDVARALCLAAERPAAEGRTYFVGHPEPLDWARLTEALRTALDRRIVTLKLPAAVIRLAGATAELLGGGRAGQIDRRRARDMSELAWTCRVERTVEELEWRPEFDVESGFGHTVEWYRKAGWL